jgi:hypothetical protein
MRYRLSGSANTLGSSHARVGSARLVISSQPRFVVGVTRLGPSHE